MKFMETPIYIHSEFFFKVYLPLYLVIILLSRILSIVKILICELYIGITILAWFIRVSTNGELKELETQEMDIETPLILVELI